MFGLLGSEWGLLSGMSVPPAPSHPFELGEGRLTAVLEMRHRALERFHGLSPHRQGHLAGAPASQSTCIQTANPLILLEDPDDNFKMLPGQT